MTTTTTHEPFVFRPHAVPHAAGNGGASDTDALVNETRREIAEIVREIAVAVRSDRSAGEFFGLLVDRIQRAMAAEGVIVWQATDAMRSVRRIGRITDQSIPSESVETHQRLLAAVASDGQPVVVPATPGAMDPEIAANPMEVPVALVPIEIEPVTDGPSYLLEVFLESNCGVATQRGYLRFVAQMADLAGEFLRSEQLRSLRRRQRLAAIIDAEILNLHRIPDRNRLAAAIVDGAADIFGFDRVGLCLGQPAKLAAVSHVESIDNRSAAAKQLCEAATVQLDVDGCRWMTENSTDRDLVLRAVVTDPASPSWRMVCLQVAEVQPIADPCRGELIRYAQHANLAWEKIVRLESIPAGRLLASLALSNESSKSVRRRKLAVSLALGIVILAAALFPVPLVIRSTAIIRPEQVQAITAPRDALVDEIHVQHGQLVSKGQLLLKLIDPDLEEQLTTLTGRRSVLVQQQSHWTEALVDTASHEMDRLEQVQGESRLVSEEIQSIDDQLAVLHRAAAALQVRANSDGIVDAWQIEQRLQSRPLRRGDWLLQVIAVDTPWTVEAQVSPPRVAALNNADQDQSLFINVSLDSEPGQTFVARLKRIGPVVAGEAASPKSTAVLLSVDEQAAHRLAARQGTSHPSGAPATVMFHCGTAPAVYVLLQDVFRSARRTAALYWAGDNRDQT